jgi:hypothetical protein
MPGKCLLEVADAIIDLSAGETITSVEQLGHRVEPWFYVRTHETPRGGWVTSANAQTYAATCAVWAAMGSKAPFRACIVYDTYSPPSAPNAADGTFNNVSRIYLE